MVASNSGTASLRPPVPNAFYTQPQQQSVDYDFKQQPSGAHIYNYVPMISQTPSNFIHQQPQHLHPQAPPTAAGSNQVSSQHGTSIPLPILVHQQPTGQIQYLFPAHALQQQQQPPPPPTNSYSITPDGQYVQVKIEINDHFNLDIVLLF